MKFSHLDDSGQARMVDIGEKLRVPRKAWAEGRLKVSPQTIQLLHESGLPKGSPFEVARLAGIQAAKKTDQLIPLCHTIALDHVDVQIEVEGESLWIRSEVSCRWATGVEMEALTAVAVAALTLYDMCKAVDAALEIGEIRLLRKQKGKPAAP